MPALIHQRCFHHAAREAAARCPECGHFFCRECVTEHDDRAICAGCLQRMTKIPVTQRHWFVAVARVAQVVAGVFTVFLFFYFLGQNLLSLPSLFHEGTLWPGKWFERQ